MIGATPDLAYPNKCSCSSRHAMHQEAQTFSSHTLPFMSSAENVLVSSLNCGRRNVGAGLLTKTEGSSCGSRLRPIARKTTSTRKRPSGIKYLSIDNLHFASLRLCGKFLAQRRKGAKKESDFMIPSVPKLPLLRVLRKPSLSVELHVPCALPGRSVDR